MVDDTASPSYERASVTGPMGSLQKSGANAHYLVGTPKGRLTRLEKDLVAKPWQEARPYHDVPLFMVVEK
jgi:hypothetical protein